MNQEIGEFLKGDDIADRLARFGLATSGAGTPRKHRRVHRAASRRNGARSRAELNIEPQ